MSAELGDTRVHRSTGRRRTAAWVALVLALVLGGLVVRTVTDRRSPLGSRPLLVRTLDHPLIMLGSQPQNRFDPPQAAERARVPAATVFRAWLRQTRHSYYDRAIPSSRPILDSLA